MHLIGRVELEKRSPDGRVLDLLDFGENLLLTAFDVAWSHLAAGDSSGRYITTMQFGTGSSPPELGDTFLEDPITPTKAVTATFDDEDTLCLTAYLLESEGNGFPISEVGLRTVGDVLVARKQFAGQVKTADKIFVWRWRIAVPSAA